jgi:Xaa-Pro dipeptidase
MSLPHIPFEEYTRRARRARELMDRRGIDVLLATPSKNLYYLTGCTVRRSDRLVALLFYREAGPSIVFPEYEREHVFSSPLRMKLITWRDDQDPIQAIRRQIGNAPGITIGLEPRTDYSVYMDLVRSVPEAQWVDGNQVFQRLRCEKSPDEIACIEAAIRITEQAFEKVPEMVREGMTERELASLLVQEMNGLGGEDSGARVQFGENAAIPSGVPGHRTLAAGEMILIDMNTHTSGYHSDMSRVFAFRRADDNVRQLYAIVLEAQRAAMEMVAPKVTAGAVDAAARNAIDRHEYGLHFTHRTGHGIGLDRHEPPYLMRGCREVLRPGMVLTVEPGIYLEGRFGIRLEDQVLVTPDGARRLSSQPPEIPVIGG